MEYSRELVAAVTALVLRELERLDSGVPPVDAGKTLLVLVCGGSRGAEEARAQLERLRRDGCRLRALYTGAGARILGKDWLEGAELVSPEGASPLQLVRECDAVVLPVLTFNTAAKAALGLADNPVSTALLHALLQGVPIFAARDACDPAGPAQGGPGWNRAYANRLGEHARALQNYGVHLTPACGLWRAVTDGIAPQRCARVDAPFPGRVLSAGDVRAWAGDTLPVSGATVVTPAARDAAVQRGIRIVPVQ